MPTDASDEALGAALGDGLGDGDIRALLLGARRIALVGASNRPERPSHGAMRFLLDRGYDVVPVNPGLQGQQIHGRTVVATLEEAAPFDMLDLFRAADQVVPPVRDAVRLGARLIWMQLGVVNREAAGLARASGLAVAMDRCPVIEWRRLQLPDRIGLAPEGIAATA
jgi:predicted CoA-binding protein